MSQNAEETGIGPPRFTSISPVSSQSSSRGTNGTFLNLSRDTLRTDLVFVWAAVLIAVMVCVEHVAFDTLSRRVDAWR